MIPQAARRKLAEFVDVFCDRGAFSAEETVAIFRTGTIKYGAHNVRSHMVQASPKLVFTPTRYAAG